MQCITLVPLLLCYSFFHYLIIQVGKPFFISFYYYECKKTPIKTDNAECDKTVCIKNDIVLPNIMQIRKIECIINVFRGFRAWQCKILVRDFLSLAFYHITTLRCNLQHIIIPWPLPCIAREMFDMNYLNFTLFPCIINWYNSFNF